MNRGQLLAAAERLGVDEVPYRPMADLKAAFSEFGCRAELRRTRQIGTVRSSDLAVERAVEQSERGALRQACGRRRRGVVWRSGWS